MRKEILKSKDVFRDLHQSPNITPVLLVLIILTSVLLVLIILTPALLVLIILIILWGEVTSCGIR